MIVQYIGCFSGKIHCCIVSCNKRHPDPSARRIVHTDTKTRGIAKFVRHDRRDKTPSNYLHISEEIGLIQRTLKDAAGDPKMVPFWCVPKLVGPADQHFSEIRTVFVVCKYKSKIKYYQNPEFN